MNTFAGPACVIATVASMIIFAAASGAAYVGIEGFGNAVAGIRPAKKRNYEEVDDIIKYGHISNLTDWYTTLKSVGYNISLDVNTDTSYYLHGSSLIAVNSSSFIYNDADQVAYIHHGTNASMIHINLHAENSTTSAEKKRESIDPYGNGYNDEEFSGNLGLKGQWCHQYGNSETLDPVNDWPMVNQLVSESTADGQTDHYNLFFFGAYDNNNGGAQIAGVEIEVETVFYKYNSEWSERGICDTAEYMVT